MADSLKDQIAAIKQNLYEAQPIVAYGRGLASIGERARLAYDRLMAKKTPMKKLSQDIVLPPMKRRAR